MPPFDSNVPSIISSREDMINLIITMHGEQKSIRALSKYFKLGRNTIRKILRKHFSDRNNGYEIFPLKVKTSCQVSKLDPFLPKIKSLLEEFPNIIVQRVFEEIRGNGYDGGYTILRERLRILRPIPKKNPVVRFVTEPGEQGQMDWSPYTIEFTQSGKQTILCFSYILGYSRRHYIDFTTDRKFHTLIRRHRDAFGYFGGVPKTCLYDGEKTVILRWEAGRPVYNPSFVLFITHYNCRPIGCRPRTPQTKGKVEKPFQYIESSLFNGRKFQDIEDLRTTAKWWLKEICDKHLHGTTRRPPIELFLENELSSLMPLPAHAYDTAEAALLVCSIEGFVRFETNLYSIPYEYVGEIIILKATEQEVFIYSPDLKLIGHHERASKSATKKIENPEHRTSKKARYGIESVRDRFLLIGEAAEEFLQGVNDKYPRNGGFHIRYLLTLKENYHCDDINSALKHANRFYAFDSRSIERILKSKFKQRTLEVIRNTKAKEDLKKTLPEITQRPLSEYNFFLNTLKDDNETEK